ncbi:MAG: hypothetical protein SGJ20_16075, partial [Planctomycetota bacterium]|nr:hypothetical protein [Planctomycetota bacterium]
MTNHQQIVDDIRAILYSPAPDTIDQLRAILPRYSAACRELNVRLARCGELLRAGLRSEAIHQADIQPRLLDQVATLDFTEREQLLPFLQQVGVPQPVPLQMDIAAELNEAYAIEDPLRELLDKHRRLALSRAPLSSRIQVLRKISHADENNLVWREDLQLYERERIRQIEGEVAQATREGDASALAVLQRELQDEPWLEQPPVALCRRTVEARQHRGRELARAELVSYEPKLNDAYSALDAAEGRAIRIRWFDALSRADVDSSDPVVDRAEPALQWLAELDRQDQEQAGFSRAVAELENSLDGEPTALELEKRFHTATRYGRELPHALTQRLHSRMLAVELNRSRRSRLIAMIAVLLIATAASGIGWLIWQSSVNSEVRDHSTALKSLMDGGQLDAAQNNLKEMENSRPRIAASGQVQELKARLTQMISDEAQRRQTLEQLLSELSDPRNADTAKMDLARKLAKQPDEKARLVTIEDQSRQYQRKLQSERDSAFAAQQQELNKDLVALQKLEVSDPARVPAELAILKEKIQSLLSDGNSISPPVRAQANLLTTQLTALEQRLANRVQQQDQLQTLIQSIGDRTAYTANLKRYYETHQAGTRSVDYRRVADEAPLWATIEAWNEILDDPSLALVRVTADKASTVEKKLADILKQHPGHPEAPDFTAKQASLKSISQRSEEGERIEAELISLFQNRLLTDLWRIETSDGHYYSYIEPKENTDGFITLQYLLSLDGTEKKLVIQPKDAKSVTINKAPQQQLAKTIVARLRSLTDATWDKQFYLSVQDILKDTSTDAILRMQLLQRVLDTGCQGSDALKQGFAGSRIQLEDAKVNLFANWLDPADEDGNRNREKAAEALTVFAAGMKDVLE